jgi:hypothetical protein
MATSDARVPRRLSILAAAATAAIAACTNAYPFESSTAPLATATLAAAAVVPAATSTMTGSATLLTQLQTVQYTVTLANSTSNPTAVHLHLGASGTNGAIIATLFNNANGIAPVNGELVKSNMAASGFTPPISLDSIVKLVKSGQVYMDVHTKQFPNGEARGQLQPQ